MEARGPIKVSLGKFAQQLAEATTLPFTFKDESYRCLLWANYKPEMEFDSYEATRLSSMIINAFETAYNISYRNMSYAWAKSKHELVFTEKTFILDESKYYLRPEDSSGIPKISLGSGKNSLLILYAGDFRNNEILYTPTMIWHVMCEIKKPIWKMASGENLATLVHNTNSYCEQLTKAIGAPLKKDFNEKTGKLKFSISLEDLDVPQTNNFKNNFEIILRNDSATTPAVHYYLSGNTIYANVDRVALFGMTEKEVETEAKRLNTLIEKAKTAELGYRNSLRTHYAEETYFLRPHLSSEEFTSRYRTVFTQLTKHSASDLRFEVVEPSQQRPRTYIKVITNGLLHEDLQDSLAKKENKTVFEKSIYGISVEQPSGRSFSLDYKLTTEQLNYGFGNRRTDELQNRDFGNRRSGQNHDKKRAEQGYSR